MDEHYRTLFTNLKRWGISEAQFLAYGSTLLISIAPFLILFVFRVENKPQHRNWLRLALAFASGGLLGDAFLHLIPHSMGHGHEEHGHDEHGHDEHHHSHSHDKEDHDHQHDDHHHHDHGHQTNVGLYIIAGIALFFIIEKIVHILKGEHGHSHSHGNPDFKTKEKVSDSEDLTDDDSDTRKLAKRKSQKKERRKPSKKVVNTVSQTRLVSGILNLIADFLHNFTDGLAIGATFSAGKGMGLITAITILVHEIPHEIGDYAILIQAGYRRRSALWLQLVTAIGALIGTAVGLHYGTLEHATQIILPITAGGFVYIAMVTVIPELLEKTSHCQSLCEILSMSVGVGMMYWIALNE